MNVVDKENIHLDHFMQLNRLELDKKRESRDFQFSIFQPDSTSLIHV